LPCDKLNVNPVLLILHNNNNKWIRSKKMTENTTAAKTITFIIPLAGNKNGCYISLEDLEKAKASFLQTLFPLPAGSFSFKVGPDVSHYSFK